jgi:hypothetical protein
MMMLHQREVKHSLDVISDWGGLHGIIFSLFGIFVGAINVEYRNAKFIRSLFVEHDDDGGFIKKKKVYTSKCDKFS